MVEYQTHAILPYSAEQLFGLAADVERYPEFVPGYESARVIEGSDRHLRVEQRVALAGHGLRFVSSAVLEPPRRLSVRVGDGPLAGVAIEWRFAEAGPGCRVEFEARFKPVNGLLGLLLNGPWMAMNRQVMSAFRAEADRRFGGR